MDKILDFVGTALPWIVMGVVVALTAVTFATKKDFLRRNLIWPAGCLALVSVLKYTRHDTTGAVTWLNLGIVFYVISITKKKDPEEAVPQKTAPKQQQFKMNREQRRRAKRNK